MNVFQSERPSNSKNTICLWYDKDAEAAARFYAATFPDSAVGAVHHAPSDYPSGKEGDVLTVEFTVLGVPCLGLNGGPVFKHNEAFSFQIATEDQEETDRYWNAIVGNGGQESQCGWCKDKWGISWQITPRVLTEALAAGGDEAKRAFDAMMGMKKIDIAAIEAARAAESKSPVGEVGPRSRWHSSSNQLFYSGFWLPGKGACGGERGLDGRQFELHCCAGLRQRSICDIPCRDLGPSISEAVGGRS